MSSFEESVVQHVLERLLTEIDKGSTTTIWYTNFNPDGSSATTSREVTVQHAITSKVVQKILEDHSLTDKLYQKLNTMIESEEFTEKVGQSMADKLISWIEQKSSWYGDAAYANRDSFKKEVRSRVVKIVAQAQADKILAQEPNNDDQ